MDILGTADIGIAERKKNENMKIKQFYFHHIVNKFVLQRFLYENWKSIFV